jgi:hypothetical protein
MIRREDDDQFGVIRGDEVTSGGERRLDVVKEIP